jgi:hypothetical protein
MLLFYSSRLQPQEIRRYIISLPEDPSMIRYVALLLAASACSVLGGENPTRYVSGNPRVDIFGSPQIGPTRSAAAAWSPASDSTPYLGTGSPESEAKSPWLAGALSLVIPGLGEVYTKQYVKGAAFFLADVAFWSLAYSYDKKGDRATDDFQNFANTHYSAARYADWTISNLPVLNSTLTRSPDSYRAGVFPDDVVDCGPPYGCMDWDSLNQMERDIASAPYPNGYTHVMPAYNQQQYYELIGKYDEFSRGWDDADLSPITTNDLPIKSNSKEFYEYAAMRADANHWYDVAGTYVSIAVVNHVLSAADAFWSATRFNKDLRAEVRMQLTPTPYGLQPSTIARFSYRF